MDSLQTVKVQPSRRKKRIGRKVFERKLKKLATGWQITDKYANVVKKSLTKETNVGHFSTRKKKSSKKCKSLNDVTRKLLELSSASVEDKANVIETLDKNESNNTLTEDTSVTEYVDLNAANNEENVESDASSQPLEAELFDGTISKEFMINVKAAETEENGNRDDSLHSSFAEISDIGVGESINEEVLDDEYMENGSVIDFDDVPEEIEENNDIGENHCDEFYGKLVDEAFKEINSEGDDNFLCPVRDECNDSSLNLSKTERYNFKKSQLHDTLSCSSNNAIVIEMETDAPAPKHPLISTSAVLPFPYLENSPQSVINNLKTSLHKVDFSQSKNTLKEAAQSFIFHILPDNKLLLGLKYPNVLFFQGKFSITIFFGSVEVLGYEMTASNFTKTYTVYSPRGVSLLGLSASKRQSSSMDWSSICDKLANLNIDTDVNTKISEVDALLLLKNTPCHVTEFINSHFSMKLFSSRSLLCNGDKLMKKAEEILDSKFIMPGTAPVKMYSKVPEWDACFETINWNGKARIVVCGGKSVGKSTFLRFLVNKAIIKFKKILYLDFDPGQSEFTVPGCVSAVLVSEPLLGPNYTHLLAPERMVYIGEINVGRCPVRYLESVQHVIEYCHSQPQFSDIPLFINTMGFSKGLGVELTVNIIRMVGPTTVVQIQSSLKKRNFPELLDSAYVCDYQSMFCSFTSSSYSDLAYEFHELPSVAEETQSEEVSHWGMEAHNMRDLLILSYLSQILTPVHHSLTEVVPYKLPFSKLNLCVCHEAVQYSQYLSAMNCNLVALCSIGDEDILIPNNPEYPRILSKLPVCPCLGFGIVRGIDLEAKVLFLLTPVSEKNLSQVNCLVLGPVSLPAGVLLKNCDLTGHIPYVTKGAVQPIGKKIKSSRSVAQLHKKRVHL